MALCPPLVPRLLDRDERRSASGRRVTATAGVLSCCRTAVGRTRREVRPEWSPRDTLSALLLPGRAPTSSTGCATTSDTTCSTVVAILGRNHRRARLPGTGAHRVSWGPPESSSRTFPSRGAARSRGHFSWFFAVLSTSGLGPPHHPCRARHPPIAASRRSPVPRDKGSSLDASGDIGNRVLGESRSCYLGSYVFVNQMISAVDYPEPT